MGDFETLLEEALKSFVSNQWFGVCIELPKSRDCMKQGFVSS